MEEAGLERITEELTLLLLYLSSWEEWLAPGTPEVHRAWKTFRFEILDALTQQGYLETNRRTKSVRITEDGVKKARELERKYQPR